MKNYVYIGVLLVIVYLILTKSKGILKAKDNRNMDSIDPLKNKNVIAFLKTLRVGEGTSGENGYKTLFGGEQFTSYADHPNIKITKGSYTSTASGSYQILYSTWLECKKNLGLTDFTPLSQDKCAIYLIRQKGALNDVINGNFTTAVNKVNKIWASLPNSPYGQPTVKMEDIINKYKQYGGTLS
jgi:lysozyme